MLVRLICSHSRDVRPHEDLIAAETAWSTAEKLKLVTSKAEWKWLMRERVFSGAVELMRGANRTQRLVQFGTLRFTAFRLYDAYDGCIIASYPACLCSNDRQFKRQVFHSEIPVPSIAAEFLKKVSRSEKQLTGKSRFGKKSTGIADSRLLTC